MLQRLIMLITLLWSGMIFGVSLESWAKFQTSHLSLTVALNIGRTVFYYFQNIQWILLIVLILMSIFVQLRVIHRIMIAAISIFLMIQCVWLFPRLSQQISILLMGDKPLPSYVHAVYGLLEAAKCFTLIYLGMSLCVVSTNKS